jgi:hypothetical protein
MSVSFAAVFVKLSNRRRGKTPTVTCGRICQTVALSTISLGVLSISSQTVIAQVND